MKESDFTKVPIEELTEVPKKCGFYELTANRWWAVTADDCLLFYRGASKQCNANKGIVERLLSSENHPAVKVVFLEAVWTRHDCYDYI